MNTPAREEALFQVAVQLGAAERAAYLDHECAGDPALRKRLEALLAAHDQPDTLFGTQAGGARPTISLDLAHDLADDLVGQTIGRYKLREKIGEGGCGVAYVAEQTEPVRRRVWDAATGLPLGRPQPASGFLSQWRFDPAGRVLCVGRQPEADSSDSWIWRLPRAEPPRGGMEALTCLTTTCRLDETGNPVLLTPAEIHQIESSLGGALSP